MFIVIFATSFRNKVTLQDMKTSTYTQETLIIEKPSKGLLNFINQLRDRKLSQQEKLRNQKAFNIEIKA